ncbi:MAG: histidine kinase, partial [Anaerolineae bacterium]
MNLDATSDPAPFPLRLLFALLSLVVPALVAYDLYFQLSTPALDFTVDAETGEILQVTQESFADWAGLLPGDVILSVDGVPFPEWSPPAVENYPMTVRRGDEQLSLELPVLLLARINRMSLISGSLTALVFWASGAVLVWRRFRRQEVRLLFVAAQSMAVAVLFLLAHPGGTRLPWMTHLSVACFQLGAPFLLHHITIFPLRFQTSSWWRRGVLLLYGLTFLVIVVTWLSDDVWLQWGVLCASLVVLAAICLLVYVYTRHASPAHRRRLRLILFGDLAAGLIVVIFYLLPAISGITLDFPRWISGFFLILAPLGYLVATIRYRLFEIDRLLNRAIVYVLLSLGILMLYLGPMLLIYRYLPGDLLIQLLLVSALTLLVGLSFDWVRTRAQQWVDLFFYGGWYDYPVVVEEVSNTLARTVEREAWVHVLTQRVPRLMRLREAHLHSGDDLPSPGSASSSAYLRFPLSFQGQVHAVWMVGSRRDGDDFTATDRRILNTLARQAEISLGNVLLVEALRQRLEEIREAQRRLLRSREEERAHLARELHDGPIQLLVGLNLQLRLLGDQAEVDSLLLKELQAIRIEIRRLLSDLRQVCSDLRPPMLDTLGLGAAIRALTEAWSKQEGVAVSLDLPSDNALRTLSPEVAVNLYRVVQESLTNVARHAEAEQVIIRLRLEDESLSLTIQDDGLGFTLPASLDTLLAEGHYGLVGMRERVELIG